MENCKKGKKSNCGAHAIAVALLLVFFQTSAWAESKSSCEKCHLDEDMLTATLKVDTSVSSAMQSGAG
nr:hypothetical protein [Desulfobulbaceae bacterium]